MTEYLDVEDLLALTRDLGAGPVRDLGLLSSSTARPQSGMFGQEAYPTLTLKAAALLHSICKNHALVDGNKRLAWHATIVFLDINGVRLNLHHDDAFQLVIDVAEGKAETDDIAKVFEAAAVPLTSED